MFGTACDVWVFEFILLRKFKFYLDASSSSGFNRFVKIFFW